MSQDVNANKNKVYKVVLTGGRSVSMHMFYAKKVSDGLFTFFSFRMVPCEMTLCKKQSSKKIFETLNS